MAATALDLKPTHVAAVSAGSAVACALFAGTFEKGFSGYLRSVAQNERNLYPKNLLRGCPVFPHANMYRNAILDSVDAPALSRLHKGPELKVLIATAPRWAGLSVAMLLGVVATGLDGDCIHGSMARKMGFKPQHISVRDCSTPEELADLILASSCVPPLTPKFRRNGVTVLDGGLVDNVPVDGIPTTALETLVLLTRQFRSLPSIPGRTYVQPSRPIPAGAWDYTSDSAIQSTFDLGCRDAEYFCLQCQTLAAGQRA